MAEVRFYTDEHISRAVVIGLRRRGVDVLSAAEAGMLGASDEDHLALGLELGRAVLTQDSDFLALAATGTAHAGIVYAPQHTPIGTIVRGAMLVHQMLTAEEFAGSIEFI